MGSTLSGYPGGMHWIDPYDYSTSGPSLENQTFKIHGQKYTLLQRLGGGAFGSVWSATSSDGRRAAIKAIDVSGRRGAGSFDSYALVESFEKEIKMAYKMRQETRHVVTIYGFDFDARSGLALMAMELGGDTLAKRIEALHTMTDARRRDHRAKNMISPSSDYISSRERKNIWVQLNNIVQTLHRHRVVHRDMKPENLVFFGPIMKIVDLGIAQKELSGYDANVGGMGTPYYSAPECFHRHAHITSKADIWSAGAILYQMTYGKPPRAGSSRPPANSLATHSPNVENVINNCLQEDPRRRGSHHWLAKHPYTTNSRIF